MLEQPSSTKKHARKDEAAFMPSAKKATPMQHSRLPSAKPPPSAKLMAANPPKQMAANPPKTTKPPSAKQALKAAPPADVALIKSSDVKKRLSAHVKTLARMVDDDWHDGYEDQGQECLEWIASCGEAVEAALRVGVAHGCGHAMGHEVLDPSPSCILSRAAVASSPCVCSPRATLSHAMPRLAIPSFLSPRPFHPYPPSLVPGSQARGGHLGPDHEDSLPLRPG